MEGTRKEENGQEGRKWKERGKGKEMGGKEADFESPTGKSCTRSVSGCALRAK